MADAYDSDDYDFEGADAGSSATYPMQAGALRKGGYAMLKDRPCKIVEITTSKTGKHGHAKAVITGLDIFTGDKKQEISPTSHNMSVPVVKRQEYTVIDVDDDGYCTLMDEDGNTREDLTLPDGKVGESIRSGVDDGDTILVSVIAACDEEKILDCRTARDD
eukprot:PLAT227.12.p2 GENE.PLAT227.12~~PLAT227.12.p2  ORF type:complete len:162 (+),score=69.88 PLAT227.12:174-659(+)